MLTAIEKSEEIRKIRKGEKRKFLALSYFAGHYMMELAEINSGDYFQIGRLEASPE